MRSWIERESRGQEYFRRATVILPSRLFRLFADLLAISRRRQTELALEGAVERSFGFVADIQRHLQDCASGRLDPSRRELKTPARQVCQRRLAEKTGKPLDEHRTRGPGFGSKVVQAPTMPGLPMQRRECSADDVVPRSGQPPGLVGRQLFHVPAQGLDEERLCHLGAKDGLSWTPGSRFGDEMANRVLQP